MGIQQALQLRWIYQWTQAGSKLITTPTRQPRMQTWEGCRCPNVLVRFNSPHKLQGCKALADIFVFWKSIEVYLVTDMLDTLWRTLWKKPLCKPLGTLWSHWWAHCERTQHVPTGDIVIPSLGTLWMWSPCPHWAHCDQIDGDIVNVITMYPLGTLESHGWVHFKCDQHLPTGHIIFT